MSSKDNKQRNPKKEKDQWVLITEESTLNDDRDNPNEPVFVKLQHPKTEKGAMFLFSNGDTKVSEVMTFKEEFRSWFIEQIVQQDGALYITTSFDPIFLVLPYLELAFKGGKFMTLDQIVVDDEYPECRRLQECSGLEQLHIVADCKGSDDLKAYRYNKDKTLSWLKLKVNRLADTLKDKKVHCRSGASSATFIRSTKSDDTRQEDYVRYAHGIVSDYLRTDLSSDLSEYLGIQSVPDKSPVKEPPKKKAKLENVAPKEDYSDKNANTEKTSKYFQNTKMTSAQKQLSKVDKKGMKSISSFFSPKAKK